jgi:uncharacterized protein YeaO (DUF488 family)
LQDDEAALAIRVLKLGTPRVKGEGIRIGTVRRPPRGVRKTDFARHNWFDVWFPLLSPSAETVKLAQGAKTADRWASFVKKYRAEMAKPDASHAIELLAMLSQDTNFSVGCYCENEERCHRSILRSLLIEKGANVE